MKLKTVFSEGVQIALSIHVTTIFCEALRK